MFRLGVRSFGQKLQQSPQVDDGEPGSVVAHGVRHDQVIAAELPAAAIDDVRHVPLALVSVGEVSGSSSRLTTRNGSCESSSIAPMQSLRMAPTPCAGGDGGPGLQWLLIEL